MKIVYRFLLGIVMTLFVSSCVSTKKIVYFQGAEETFQQAQQIIQQYEMRLKPADQVLVKLTCSEPDLLNIFSQDVVMGNSRSNTFNSTSSTNNMSTTYGYTVTNEGNLILPVIGHVHVDGCTSEEAALRIQQRIIDANLIKDPEVTVRLLNARVAVLGAVRSPQVVSLTSERNTVLDVLSKCGDMADASLRQRVKLFREVDGKRMMYELDLTKAEIFNNPAFYVQQNDLIYVEPNKSQTIKSSAFYSFLSAGSSILSLVSVVISLVFALKK